MIRQEIHQYFKKIFYNLDDQIIEQLLEFSESVKLKKGTKIIKEGERHNFMYLIISGCVKSYYFNDDKEICIWFAFENEIATTIKTFYGEISNETIVTLEDSQLIKINTKILRNLENKEITISHLITNIAVQHALFLEKSMYLRSLRSKDRYITFVDKNPSYLSRLSLTDVASFLGITKETLSRIRSGKLI